MTRKTHRKARRTPGKGMRLRGTETMRTTCYFDGETFQQIHTLAEKQGTTLTEQVRQLVEFGLETVQEGQEDTNASIT